MIPVFRKKEKWSSYRDGLPDAKTLGFVPTMGGLHEGHCSLIRRSLAENDFTVVSIFLNRTQFNNVADFESYPANFEQDVALLQDLGIGAVFAPDYDSMYPDNYAYVVSEALDSKPMEGAERPGHFDGVLTVLLKLLNIVSPDRAYFGEKDYQQLQLVKGMVQAFFLPVEIVACETVRAEDGLALSSRNHRLSREARALSAMFPRILNTSEDSKEAECELKKAGFDVEYVEDKDGRRYGAVRLEGVRLIDNFALRTISQKIERSRR